MRKIRSVVMAALLMLAACDFNLVPQEATPTAPPATITVQPATATAFATTSPTPAAVMVASDTPTWTPLPPTDTETPTVTPGPYEHVIKQGDSLITIVQLYGYTDFRVAPGSIISQIVAINNLANADTLPPPGVTILIPRQTATPTPVNDATAAADRATQASQNPVVAVNSASITDYIVQSGDTFVGIAQDNNTTIEVLAVLNPEVNVFGCNFQIPSGGPGCNPPLQIGQVLKVPAPTPTPTLSPTPSGSETPTPTPTYAPPILIYPPEGAVAPPGVFSLQWVSVGVLRENEVYLVQVVDTTTGVEFRTVTRDTSVLLPESMIPTDGRTHAVQWTVRVAVPNERGVYGVIGGDPHIRSFQWQSR